MSFQTAYLAHLTRQINPRDGSFTFFPNTRQLHGDGTHFFYRKCKEDVPVTKLFFKSDGVKEFQICFEWEPTADQLLRKPHLAIANRVASYEELDDPAYRSQDMPQTDQPFPDTYHTGWMTLLTKNPRLPADRFVDYPYPTVGETKIVGTDPGQIYITQSVDRNMTRVRDEYDAEMARLDALAAQGLITEEKKKVDQLAARDEAKSHFRSISGNMLAEQTLTARDERLVAAHREKNHDRWIQLGEDDEYPSYNVRMEELKGAARSISAGSLEALSDYFSLHALHWRSMSSFVNRTCKASSRHFDRRAAHHHFLEKAVLYNSFNLSHAHFIEMGQSCVLGENRKKRKRRARERHRKLKHLGFHIVLHDRQVPEATLLLWGEGYDGTAAKGHRATMQKVS